MIHKNQKSPFAKQNGYLLISIAVGINRTTAKCGFSLESRLWILLSLEFRTWFEI